MRTILPDRLAGPPGVASPALTTAAGGRAGPDPMPRSAVRFIHLWKRMRAGDLSR